MRPIIATTIIASGLSSLFTMQSYAVDVARVSASNFRVVYDNDNAPQSVVFKQFLSGLSTSIKDRDRSQNNYLLPGMTSSANVDELFDYFMVLYAQIESEISDTTRRMLCPNDRRRPTGAELFSVYDAIDDVRNAIYDKYLAIAKAEVAAYAVFDIDRALDNIPETFGSYWLNHEKAYGGSESHANEVAAKMCANFESAGL